MKPDPDPSEKEPYKGQPEKQAAYWKERYEIARDENAALRADKERMNQLEQLTVNVRQPLVHGSRDLFWASPTDDDGDEQPSDIRAQLDKLRTTKPTQP